MNAYYTIVEGHSREELIKNVNAAAANGYIPQGSPQKQYEPGRREYGSPGLWWQAMICREGR